MNRQLLTLSLSALIITTGLVVGRVASAQVTTSSPSLPVTSGVGIYQLGNGPIVYPQGVVLQGVNHSVTPGTVSEQIIGGNEVESFGSTLTGTVSLGGSPFIPFSLSGPVDVTVIGRDNPSELGTFGTQMTSMDLTGSVAGHTVAIDLNPGDPTLGVTNVTDVGGGMFHITSFFDVFTELSVDGGPFIASSSGAEHMVLVPASDVPEPGDIQMSAALVLGCLSALRLRRNRRI